MDFEENLEPVRPEFETKARQKGEYRINPITGDKELSVPARKRVPFYFIAIFVALFTVSERTIRLCACDFIL